MVVPLTISKIIQYSTSNYFPNIIRQCLTLKTNVDLLPWDIPVPANPCKYQFEVYSEATYAILNLSGIPLQAFKDMLDEK